MLKADGILQALLAPLKNVIPLKEAQNGLEK
jgi:hypothetical protein